MLALIPASQYIEGLMLLLCDVGYISINDESVLYCTCISNMLCPFHIIRI